MLLNVEDQLIPVLVRINFPVDPSNAAALLLMGIQREQQFPATCPCWRAAHQPPCPVANT